jgi:hypothetical protein
MSGRRAHQCWFSVQTLTFLFELSERTIWRALQQGDFGPPPGGDAADYVIDVPGGPRVSSLGYSYFVSRRGRQPLTDAVVFARNGGELRRKLSKRLEANGSPG